MAWIQDDKKYYKLIAIKGDSGPYGIKFDYRRSWLKLLYEILLISQLGEVPPDKKEKGGKNELHSEGWQPEAMPTAALLSRCWALGQPQGRGWTREQSTKFWLVIIEAGGRGWQRRGTEIPVIGKSKLLG